MGVHLNIFRELLGLNTIVCYAGLVIAISPAVIAPYTNFMLSAIVVICSVIATFSVAKHFGRKCMLIFSSSLFTLCNLMIALGMLISLPYFTLGWMIVLMAVYGLVYSPVSWTYPT
jgi:MFS family permease